MPYIVPTTIRNGFPLVLRCSKHPAEPDIGINDPWVEIDEVLTQKEKSASFLKLTRAEVLELEEKAWGILSNSLDFWLPR